MSELVFWCKGCSRAISPFADLPLCLHCRKAEETRLATLAMIQGKQDECNPPPQASNPDQRSEAVAEGSPPGVG